MFLKVLRPALALALASTTTTPTHAAVISERACSSSSPEVHTGRLRIWQALSPGSPLVQANAHVQNAEDLDAFTLTTPLSGATFTFNACADDTLFPGTNIFYGLYCTTCDPLYPEDVATTNLDWSGPGNEPDTWLLYNSGWAPISWR